MGKNLKGKELGKGLSQRKDGTYMARFVDRYGKRKTFYGKNINELKRKLNKERYQSEYGFYGDGTDITLNEWFEEFLKLYKEGVVKVTTLYRIRQTYAVCKKSTLGTMRLRDITVNHVQKLINEMRDDGNTYGTINLFNNLLKQMFTKAMGNGYMYINPCAGVVLPKKVKYEARYLTPDEQKMFLESAKEYYHYDIFCADLSIGARIGELLGLKWSDIDFDKKEIHIQRTLHYQKTSENESCHFFFTTPKSEAGNRVIPLLSETEAVLERVRRKQLANKKLHSKVWQEQEGFEDLVFTTQYGAPVRYGDVNRTIKMVVTKANLQEEEIARFEGREPRVLEVFSPHTFRHTFITNASRNNVPYDVIRPFVGHSKDEMTAYYDHTETVVDFEALKKVSFLAMV